MPADAARLWDEVPRLLDRWHRWRDRDAARRAVSFLEIELRRATPAMVRSQWTREQIEDALREVLATLLNRPLPAGALESPERYFVRVYRNHCIDLHRQRQRQEQGIERVSREVVLEVAVPQESVEEESENRSTAANVRESLARLRPEDRVVFLLVADPSLLSEDDLAWLSLETGRSREAVRAALRAAEEEYDLSRIFDPGDDSPDDPIARRKRMERFRKRRAVARQALTKELGRFRR